MAWPRLLEGRGVKIRAPSRAASTSRTVKYGFRPDRLSVDRRYVCCGLVSCVVFCGASMNDVWGEKDLPPLLDL